MEKIRGKKHYCFWTRTTTMRPLKYMCFFSSLVGMEGVS